MARAFVAASVTSLSVSNDLGVAGANPDVTMVAWVRPGDYDLSGVFAINDTGAADRLVLGVSNSGGSGVVFTEGQAGGTGNTVSSSNGLTTSVWHHIGLTYTGGNLSAYKNGVLDGGPSAIGAGSFNNLDTAYIGRDEVRGYFDGDIAEVAIWLVALTAGELAALAKGISPLLIRPQSLQGYWPVLGNDSPERDAWKNGFNMTVNNGPAKASHTRVIYPV